MIRLSHFVAVALLALCACRLPGVANSEPSIAGFLVRSAHEWNRGNLDAFMQAYEDSPDTVYMNAKGVIHGYAAIRAHYASHYGTGMGALSFSDISVRRLGNAYALVSARWHLAMKSGAHPSGNFSLVLHHSAAGWHIIEDDTP